MNKTIAVIRGDGIGPEIVGETIGVLDAAAKRMSLDPSRMMVNIGEYANTTAATIPTALHQCREEGRVGKGDLVVLAAFGAGFTWGATLLKWAY